MDADGPPLSPGLGRALGLADELHRAQIRKGSEARPVPYLAHLLEVTAIVLAESVPEDVAIAAVLHDAPEDQGGERTLAMIREGFGSRVADLVAACSDTFEQPKPQWVERKRRYLGHLASVDDYDVLLIKCADCLSNARATLFDLHESGDLVWQRFTGMPCATNQVWWCRSVRDAVELVGRYSRPFRELDDTVNALAALAAPCLDVKHEHVAISTPGATLFDDEVFMAAGLDPRHRCPKCGRVPWAPADGLGRTCPACGNEWLVDLAGEIA